MQAQRDSQPLFAGHAAVMANLMFQCGGRCHGLVIVLFEFIGNFENK